MQEHRVVFPLPAGPVIKTISPGAMVRLISDKAKVWLPEYENETFLNSIG
jgi:hypothetical protein